MRKFTDVNEAYRQGYRDAMRDSMNESLLKDSKGYPHDSIDHYNLPSGAKGKEYGKGDWVVYATGSEEDADFDRSTKQTTTNSVDVGLMSFGREGNMVYTKNYKNEKEALDVAEKLASSLKKSIATAINFATRNGFEAIDC